VPIGAGFGGLGLLFVVIGIAMLVSKRRFGRYSERAEGTIVGLRAGAMAGAWRVPGTTIQASANPDPASFYVPTVRFTTAGGRQIEAESRLGTNPAPGHVGDSVRLHYDPRRPERFRVDSVSRTGGRVAIGLILMGGLFATVGIGLAQATG